MDISGCITGQMEEVIYLMVNTILMKNMEGDDND